MNVLANILDPYWAKTIVRVVGALAVALLVAGTLVYVYLFKAVSFMQSRLGPMEAGPHGSLQLMAEVGKFLQKEDIYPTKADRVLFKLAPYVVFLSTFLLVLVIPFGPDAWFADLDVGIYFALSVSSISVIGILMAGWSSANKYSLLGGLRAAGQLIAYELPLVLAVVGVVIQAGTLNMQGIVSAQGQRRDLRLRRHRQSLHLHAVHRLLDLHDRDAGRAHADTVRHADRRVRARHRLSHRIHRYAVPAVLHRRIRDGRCVLRDRAVLFLGGWSLPGLSWDSLGDVSNVMNVIGPVVLIGKVMVLSFIIFWVRFTFPRFREDQLQKIAWKYLIPLSLLNIAATAILKVAF
jgi:NADH-quinone oxidoreductase subunit H